MIDSVRGNVLEESELISVLMAVYNTEVEFLDIALDSIMNQTYKNLEIVIIDDGSTDLRTKSYLDGIKDERVHIFRNKQNGAQPRLCSPNWISWIVQGQAEFLV